MEDRSAVKTIVLRDIREHFMKILVFMIVDAAAWASGELSALQRVALACLFWMLLLVFTFIGLAEIQLRDKHHELVKEAKHLKWVGWGASAMIYMTVLWHWALFFPPP